MEKNEYPVIPRGVLYQSSDALSSTQMFCVGTTMCIREIFELFSDVQCRLEGRNCLELLSIPFGAVRVPALAPVACLIYGRPEALQPSS